MTEKKSKKSVGAAMGRSAAYMKSSVVFVLLALLFAVASAVITIIGPDKVGEIATIMSDGLFGKIDLAAIAKIGVNKTSSFIGVSTIVSILAGALALGEPLHIGQIVGAAVIVAGVYTANRA